MTVPPSGVPLADRMAIASDRAIRHLATCRTVLPPDLLAAVDLEAGRRAAAAKNPAEVSGAGADILVTATADRWAFRGATDAGRDYVAALGAFGGGELGLPPALGERFIAGARTAGLALADATEPATMPRIERAVVVEAVAS